MSVRYLFHYLCLPKDSKLMSENFIMYKIESICRQLQCVPYMLHYFFDRVESIVGKGMKNAGNLYFLLFP